MGFNLGFKGLRENYNSNMCYSVLLSKRKSS